MLAMQAAGSSDSADFKDHVFGKGVAKRREIMPGDLAAAVLNCWPLANIDYVGICS
jgi:branched-chain amino acid transport system substrate-binding protein